MVVLDSKDVSPRQGIQQAKSLYLRLLFDMSCLVLVEGVGARDFLRATFYLSDGKR